jgi:hypothetical protein
MPRHYVCGRAPFSIDIDGDLDKPVWRMAAWTEDFVDIQGLSLPPPRFRTRAKMLWDDQFLYIGAELDEPTVWATITERDSVIFQDNDFEVFLDPGGDNRMYVELEINAFNTVWDLLLASPYRDGGPAITGFDLHGLKTAVKVDGKLNDPGVVSKGWSVETAIPWSALKEIAGCPCPPRESDRWRINFSRVEWEIRIEDGKILKIAGKPEDNWVWSPQGVIDMHHPEKWGVLQFTFNDPASVPQIAIEGAKEQADLMCVYHAQRQFRQMHRRWAASPAELGCEAEGLEIWSTPTRWEARIGDWTVNETSRLMRVP